jgi:Tat protein secretion system quality control protein TatD with DNase activity
MVPEADVLMNLLSKIHIHCFTDSPEFAQRLLKYFCNLYIGITGKLVIIELDKPLN